MTSTVSTTVKIVVAMVVVAALVATTFTSKASTGLKGTRKLQFGGIVQAISEGVSNTGSAVTTGAFGVDPTAAVTGNIGAIPAGTGASFGTGSAVGTSNGFIQSTGGQAIASGTAGGNSTSNNDLTVLSMNPNPASAGTGGGLSGGTLASVGQGSGTAGGNAVFGPSLAAAIAAATPAAAAPATETAAPAAEADSGNKKNKKDKNTSAVVAATAPVAPTAPAFSFDPDGLPTGGGGGGSGSGSGDATGTISSPDNVTPIVGTTDGNEQFFADEAYGTSLANGFGFGVGSGVAINGAGEQAGGSGGATAFGQGDIAFELDDIKDAAFANSGTTTSDGGASAFVGFDPPAVQTFGAFKIPAASAVP